MGSSSNALQCSLTQPCANCARRFPQPICEYSTKDNRLSYAPALAKSGGSAAKVEGLYSHLDLESVYDALLQVEEQPGGRGCSSHALSGQLAQPESLVRLQLRDVAELLRQHDVVQLLNFILATRLGVANRILKDELQIEGTQLFRASQEKERPSCSISGFDENIRCLPMVPTKMNKELVRTHLQLMSRFKASLDGRPQPNNRFMKLWIPLSIQDPLILHVVLCSTASFLHETGHLPKTVLYMHRATVARLLNNHISSPSMCTDDSAMLAVTQLIVTSWYWGSTQELHAHMDGFKKMIQKRGGMQNLGMEGYTSKMALVHDFVIALAHESEPTLFNDPKFEFRDPQQSPLQVSFNSPLLFDCPPFLSPASPLRLHSCTARVLDSIRSLLKVIMDLPEHPGAGYCDRIRQEAILALSIIVNQTPADVPLRSDHTPKKFCSAIDGSERSAMGSQGGQKMADATDAPIFDRDSSCEHRHLPTDDEPDLVHRCVRTTAILSCRSVLCRFPISRCCSDTDFEQIWGWVWQAGLDRWASLSGIFTWIMTTIVPSCHNTVHARMAKTLTVTSFTYVGTENWHVAVDMAKTSLKLQTWLKQRNLPSPSDTVSSAFGGEYAIERLGFAFRDSFPDSLPQHGMETGL